MKIALTFPGCHRRGGVERILYECAGFLSSRDHDVHVFANDWEKDPSGAVRYHYVRMQKQPSFLAGASFFRESTRRLKRFRFDVLNTHGCICPLGGVQWVHSVQAAWLERSRELRPPLSAARLKQRANPLHPVLLRLEEKHFRERNYRKLTATTSDVRADLNRLYGVPEDDVVVIPNGFSPTEFNPRRRAEQRDHQRARLGLAPDHVALLFVANELERKGYATILAALKQMRDPRLRLLVVGRPDANAVQQQAHAAGVGEAVIACGESRDIGAFHAAADVFVLPTQYEAFCLAILEALGSGLPVVTSRVPGAYNAIVPGVNGALIDDPKSGPQLVEALTPLLDDDRRARFSAQTPATVTQYQWPSVLARYEKVLIDCAQSSP